MSALHVQKKWEPFRGRWRLRKPSQPAETKTGHFGSELHASPHIHIWIGHNHIWIRQYGSVLDMWASMKFTLHKKRIRKLIITGNEDLQKHGFSILKHGFPESQSLNSRVGRFAESSISYSTAVGFWKNELTLHIFICFIFGAWFSRTLFCLSRRL